MNYIIFFLVLLSKHFTLNKVNIMNFPPFFLASQTLFLSIDFAIKRNSIANFTLILSDSRIFHPYVLYALKYLSLAASIEALYYY
jgi:hypothetical protein